MKVICARLVTGEEIIGKTVTGGTTLLGTPAPDPFSGDAWDVPKGVTILEDVRVVVMQPISRTQVGMSFIPFATANPDRKLKIDLDRYAIAVYPPQAELERGYIGDSTGIALATPGTAAKAGLKLS